MAQPPEDPRSPAGRPLPLTPPAEDRGTPPPPPDPDRPLTLRAPTEAALASTGPGTLAVLLTVGDQPPVPALLLALAMTLGLRLTLLPAATWSGAWARLRRTK